MSKKLCVMLMTAVLTMSTAAFAQVKDAKEYFTFTVPNFSQPDPKAPQPLDLVITRWATNAERDQLASALSSGGVAAVAREVSRMADAGYLKLPGYLEYTVRYANRVSTNEGEDIVLGLDHAVTPWWQQAASTTPAAGTDTLTLIELRIGKDGKGEGRFTTGDKITASGQPKSVMLDNFAQQPVLMTNVERAQGRSTH